VPATLSIMIIVFFSRMTVRPKQLGEEVTIEEKSFEPSSMHVSQSEFDLDVTSTRGPSEKEFALLSRFKESPDYIKATKEDFARSLVVEQISKGDVTIILKFIKDAQGNVSKAVAGFVKMLNWRETTHVDACMSEWRFHKVEVFKKFYPHTYFGFSKDGNPVYVERLGKLDISSFLKETSVEDYIRYHILKWEYVHRVLFPLASAKSGKKITSLITIADLTDFSSSQMSSSVMRFLGAIAEIDQGYYPESGNLYIVNAPWVFGAVWSMIKPLIGASTKGKVSIIKGNPKTQLSELIDLSCLPDFLGGNASWDTITE